MTITLKDIAAKDMSPEAKEVFMEALRRSCEDQEKLLNKAKEIDENGRRRKI